MALSLRIPTRRDLIDLEWFEVTSGDFQPTFLKKTKTQIQTGVQCFYLFILKNSNRGAKLKKTLILKPSNIFTVFVR
jgi:hypothetical protein